MEIQVGKFYKQIPSKSKLSFQLKLRYIVTKIEGKFIYFSVYGEDFTSDFKFTEAKFRKYLTEA